MDAQSHQRDLLKLKADALTESEAAEVLEYIANMQAMNRQPTEPERLHHAFASLFFRAKHKNRSRALRHSRQVM